MRCLISPSPALSSASMTVRPPSKLPTSTWPAPSFRRLKLRRRPSETVALRPQCLVVRAQMNHDREFKRPVKPNHFNEETQTILERLIKIRSTDEGFLHAGALDTSACVCVSTVKAVIMASELVDSGSLTATGLSRNICADTADTVQRTLGAYVDIFLYVSEDCHNRTFERDTVISFVDALRGLASISHILLEDALEALSHTHPKESLSEYAFNSDVKSIYRDFNCQMDDHVDGFWNPKTNPVELVFPTIYKCVEDTEYFVGLMVARRQRTLEKACGGSK